MSYSYYDPRYPIRRATSEEQLYLVHKGHAVRVYPSGERSWRGRVDGKDYYDFFGKLYFDANMSEEAKYLIVSSHKKEQALAELKKVNKVLNDTEKHLKTAAFVLESRGKFSQAKSYRDSAKKLNMINKPLTKNISRLDDLLLLQKAWNHLQTLDEIDQRMLEQDPQKAARIWDKCIKVAGEVLRKIPPIKNYGDLLYSNRSFFQDNVKNIQHSFDRLDRLKQQDADLNRILGGL